MRTAKIDFITDGGPWVNHNMPCPINWTKEKAVFDMNQNVFVPSWKAQEEGWITVKATGWRGALIRWLSRYHELRAHERPRALMEKPE